MLLSLLVFVVVDEVAAELSEEPLLRGLRRTADFTSISPEGRGEDEVDDIVWM